MDVRLPDGTIISNVPDDITKAALTERLSRNGYDTSKLAVSEPLGQRMNREIADIPRQLGLTARHAIEGVGDTLDFLSSPIRAGLNAVLPKKSPSITDLVTGNGQATDAIQPGSGKYLADLVGLPTPQNERERVVGSGAKLIAGSIVPMGAASKVEPLLSVPAMAQAKTAQDVTRLGQQLPGMAKPIVQALAANPLSQGLSAGSSGVAGQYVKETGGDDTSQFVASLAAGMATPFAIAGTGKAVSAGKSMLQSKVPASPQLQAQIDVTIDNALRPNGMTLNDIPVNVRNSIRDDVRQAMRADGMLAPDAVRRLADYRLTGTVPRTSTLTLDPVQVTQQRNLAKLGANSKDAAAQELARAENFNNRQLITGLNDLGATNSRGEFDAGQNLVNLLDNYVTSNRRNISSLYEAAKDSQGRAASLDPSVFSNTANDLLDRNLKGAFVPENIRSMMNDFASGTVPLNIHTAEQFKTIVGNAQRGAADGNVRAALGHIREALDNTPLMGDVVAPAQANGGFQLKTVGGVSPEVRRNVGQETLDAFNRARSANRSFMQELENNPALAAVTNDVAPDKFFQKFVLNGPARDLESMLGVVQGSPAVMQNLRTEVLGHLKSKALNGAADEVGNFSQSAFNKALGALGDQKLSLLFRPEEVAQLRAIGRVASYEQFQPRGSAVNNSNTTGALVGVLDRIANSPLLSKIPLGAHLAGPAERISVGIQSKQAMDAPRGLLALPQASFSEPPVGLLMSPAAFIQTDDRKKKGLLAP